MRRWFAMAQLNLLAGALWGVELVVSLGMGV